MTTIIHIPKRTQRAIESYSEFLNLLVNKTCFNQNHRLVDSRIQNLEHSLIGAANLLLSFSKVSKIKNERLEWNPFSQHPMLNQWKMPAKKDITTDFAKIQYIMNEFLEIIHESIHVLLLEPIFVGKAQIINQQKFSDMCLAFEGFAFWYADIVATQALRVALPDGEFTFARRSVSQTEFHPYRAFLSLGIKDKFKVLDVYLNAFRGYKTQLYKKKNDFFTESLNQRVVGFYNVSDRPLKLLYKNLKSMGFFTAFIGRFCSIKGLPSLLSDKTMQHFSGDLHEFCQLVAKKQFRHISGMSLKDIALVKMRRSLQMRAYYALCLEYALSNKQTYSLKSKKMFTSKSIVISLGAYLNGIEQALRKLADGDSLSGIELYLQKLDIWFDHKIYRQLRNYKVWMASRNIILEIVPQRISLRNNPQFGLVTTEHRLNKKEMKLHLDWIVGILSERIYTKNKIEKKEIKKAMTLALNLEQKLQKKQLVFDHQKDNQGLYRDWNRFVLLPVVLDCWSCSTFQIRPRQNLFKEILFVYE